MDKPFLDAISAGGMTGDGAMGSLLYERGIYFNRNFDEINVSQPELIYRIHREYLLAGSHLLESNTYGANRARLTRHGLGDKTVEINRAAIEISARAAQGGAYLAGSMGPTGLSPGELRRSESEVRAAYDEQARILEDGGADLLIIETFLQPAEMRVAVEAARAATSLPIVAQVAITNDGTVADGTDVLELATEMREWGADVVGANCNGPAIIYDAVTRMLETGLPVCAFPNAGRPQRIEDRHIYVATPENFGVYARRMYKAGVKLVGGCCGTGPDHISRVASAARMVCGGGVAIAQINDDADARQEPEPLAQRSPLGSMIGKRFIACVEINPGMGLDVSKQVGAARTVIEAGADAINIADGPRATVRMSNLALALRLKQETNAEILLHMCCRDHNLLGMQAFALGAHVVGINDLLIITGDPPKLGDYPQATAVYDLDSIGLLRMLDGFNRGMDPVGKPAPQTSFVLGTGVEPAASDFEREMLRLRQKVDAGASFVLTQPIYDTRNLERFLEASKDIPIPVIVGLLPLASHRNAEFIHNHIPGMNIPEDIRERMRLAGKGDKARKEGVRICTEALETIRDKVAGIYIMPPLGRYETACELLEALGDDRSIHEGVPGRVRGE